MSQSAVVRAVAVPRNLALRHHRCVGRPVDGAAPSSTAPDATSKGTKGGFLRVDKAWTPVRRAASCSRSAAAKATPGHLTEQRLSLPRDAETARTSRASTSTL